MDNGLDIESAYFVAVLHAGFNAHVDRLATGLSGLRELFAANAPRPHLRNYLSSFFARYGREIDWTAGDQACGWLKAQAHRRLLALGDADYPQLLANIPNPPPVLFIDGDFSHLGRAQIAIVGSRKATPSACDNARELANQIGQARLVVTSGLAAGIDRAAHEGALDGAGFTIAVFGCGIDRIYPSAHHALASRIREQGALVSEFPLGSKPLPAFFPRRNRIISGLALGTVVVEAALTSGSLLTAKHALEQGREVFAVPGSIRNPLSRGCHALLRDGAVLTESADDILAELRGFSGKLPPSPGSGADKLSHGCEAALPREEAMVLGSCDFEPRSIDLLVEQCGLTISEVSSILTVLEMNGLVRAIGGGAYVRTGKIPA